MQPLETALACIKSPQSRERAQKAMDEEGYRYAGVRKHGVLFKAADGVNTVMVAKTTGDRMHQTKLDSDFKRYAVAAPPANGSVVYKAPEERSYAGRILDVLVTQDRPMSAGEVAVMLGADVVGVRRNLVRMRDRGEIQLQGIDKTTGGRPAAVYAAKGYGKKKVAPVVEPERVEQAVEQVVEVLETPRASADWIGRRDPSTPLKVHIPTGDEGPLPPVTPQVIDEPIKETAPPEFRATPGVRESIWRFLAGVGRPVTTEYVANALGRPLGSVGAALSDGGKAGRLRKAGRVAPTPEHPRGLQLWEAQTEEERLARDQERLERLARENAEENTKALLAEEAAKAEAKWEEDNLNEIFPPTDPIPSYEAGPLLGQRVVLGMPASFWEDVFLGLSVAFGNLAKNS